MDRSPRNKRLSERLSTSPDMPVRTTMWSEFWWLGPIAFLVLVFWVPFSRLFPDVTWPTKAITLFIWALSACGALYFIYHAAFRAKTSGRRVIGVLLSISFMAMGILLTFGPPASSIAADIASMTLLATVVLGLNQRRQS